MTRKACEAPTPKREASSHTSEGASTNMTQKPRFAVIVSAITHLGDQNCSTMPASSELTDRPR